MDNISIYDQISAKQSEYESLRLAIENVNGFVDSLDDFDCISFIKEIALQCKDNIEKAISDYLNPPVVIEIKEPEPIKEEKKRQKYVKKTIFNTPILKFQTEKEVRIEILNMVNLCKEKGFPVTVEPMQRRGPQFQIIKGYYVSIDEIDGGGVWKRLLSYKKAFDKLYFYLRSKGLR